VERDPDNKELRILARLTDKEKQMATDVQHTHSILMLRERSLIVIFCTKYNAVTLNRANSQICKIFKQMVCGFDIIRWQVRILLVCVCVCVSVRVCTCMCVFLRVYVCVRLCV
jgi:hypothetical protein